MAMRIGCLVAALLVAGSSAEAAVVITGDTADYTVRYNPSDATVSSDTGYTGYPQELLVGKRASAFFDAAVFVFDLSSVTQPVESATLTFQLLSVSDATLTPDADLYGIGFASETAESSAHYGDPASPPGTPLASSVLTKSSSPGSYNVSSAALNEFLQDRPAGEAGKYVYLRLNLNGTIGNGKYYSVASASSGTEAYRPTLSVVVPEPATAAGVLMGLSLLGLRRRSRGA